MLRNNADARRCSYFELGLPVVLLACFYLRNRPDKNDSKNGNEHIGMQKKVLTFLLSVLTSDWLKQQKLAKLHKAVHIFILTFQPSSI